MNRLTEVILKNLSTKNLIALYAAKRMAAHEVDLGKKFVEKLWNHKASHVKDIAGNQTSNC
jgi:hypothetical protein